MFLENPLKSNKQFGSIEVICGSMFSGKTEALIQKIKYARNKKLNTIVFKPKIDNRYSNNSIVSHNNDKLQAIVIKSPQEILNHTNGCDVIAIDEVQFFNNEIIKICDDLANDGVQVILAGLDMDFNGDPFGPIPYLMAIAEKVTKLHAKCFRSGKLAQFTFRKSLDDKLFLIGEKKQYEALSRVEYYKAMKEKSKK